MSWNGGRRSKGQIFHFREQLGKSCRAWLPAERNSDAFDTLQVLLPTEGVLAVRDHQRPDTAPSGNKAGHEAGGV